MLDRLEAIKTDSTVDVGKEVGFQSVFSCFCLIRNALNPSPTASLCFSVLCCSLVTGTQDCPWGR